jgi:PAS domain S-box-containing protein
MSERLKAFPAVVDVLPLIAYLADADGRITFVSSGWERFTGNAAAELSGRSYLDLVHPEDMARVAAAWRSACAAEASYNDELRIRFGDGSYRWIATRADPIRAENGELVAWCGLIREVHEWRLAEKAMAEALSAADERAASLTRSEERYRLLSESLPGTTWTAGPDGMLEHVAQGAVAALHAPVATGLGAGWLDAVHPDEREAVEAQWQESIRSGAPYDTQFRVRMAGGEYRWHLVRALAQRDAGGNIIRWVGVNVDIHDQRLADEAREKFVALVENSGDIIAMTDREGRLTYANPAARALLSLEDSTPSHIIELFATEDRAYVESVIVPQIEREGRWVSEFQMRNVRSGVRLPILHSAFALKNARGETLGIGTISRDLRERQRIDIGMRALVEAGAVMYGSLDYEETLRNIAEAVARTFATFCSIDMVDARGEFRRVAIAHPVPEMRAYLRRYADQTRFTREHPVSLAIREGISSCINDVEPDWLTRFAPSMSAAIAALGVRSIMTVPVRAPDGSILGALSCSLDRDDPNPAYTPDDLPFAEELGRRAGIAVQHARAYEREHAIAMRFQEASLPGHLPAVPGLKLWADYRPGNSEATIGGDWYDAFLLEDKRVVITIGDVLGKGLDSAVTMAKVRQAMRSAAALLPDPAAMLTAAESAVRDVAPDTYATALAAIFDPSDRRLTFASAGHAGPAVLLVDGTLEEYAVRGMMLGLRPAAGAPEDVVTRTLSPGSTLVFYTDGLTEATRDIEEGYRRLQTALADPGVGSAPNRARALVDHVLGGRLAADDVAVLVLEIDPAPVRGEWRVPARVENVSPLRKTVRDCVAPALKNASDRLLVELAVGELAANAVKYGTGASFDVAVQTLGGHLILTVANEGSPFERPIVDMKADGLSESGRGLALLADLGFALAIACAGGRCSVTATLPLNP